MRKDIERLRDIQDAITNIEKYADKGEQAFKENELIQIWIIYHLQIIGEAAASMSQEFINLHPEIPWRDMIYFRNIVVQKYFRVDPKIVWTIVTKELPKLKKSIISILNKN